MGRDEITASILFSVTSLLAMVCFVFYPSAYLWLTYEDLIVEWAQFYFLLAAIVFLLGTIGQQKEYRLWLFLLLGMCLYVAGEEISWGQRLFNFDVPQLFQQYNLQRETNLHNFVVGPYDTLLKRFSEVLVALILGCAAFYSHSVSHKFNPVRALKQRWIASPPHFLWLFFAAAALLELRLLEINEAEFAELLVCFAVAVYAMHVYFSFRKDKTVRLAKAMIILFVVGFGAATLTTVSLYRSPQIQSGMLTRMSAGKKVFAHRYQQLGMLDQSQQLLLSLLSHTPQPWLLRALAENRHLQHDEKGFLFYNQQAIDTDEQQHLKHPDDVLLNLSLFESYAQRQQRDKASFHLRKAAAVAAADARSTPENAEAAYLLGRVYQIVGKRGLALQQFELACNLNPAEQKYRQARVREAQRERPTQE